MEKSKQDFRLNARLNSFKAAGQGLITLLKNEHNSWVHLLVSIAVIALGCYFFITAIEWCLLIIAISLVWMAEALNSAIEYLCDKVSPEIDPLIKQAKDVAAAAVLLGSIGAVLIGLIVFYPYLAQLIAGL
jgi:diacylglycerol kinase (ATP)